MIDMRDDVPKVTQPSHGTALERGLRRAAVIEQPIISDTAVDAGLYSGKITNVVSYDLITPECASVFGRSHQYVVDGSE